MDDAIEKVAELKRKKLIVMSQKDVERSKLLIQDSRQMIQRWKDRKGSLTWKPNIRAA